MGAPNASITVPLVKDAMIAIKIMRLNRLHRLPRITPAATRRRGQNR